MPGPYGTQGELLSTYGGSGYASIAAATVANTVVKAATGRLCRVVVITTGTNPLSIFDNATTNSGTIVGQLPASPAVGASFDFHVPVLNGITVGGNAANPGVVVTFY